MAGENDKALAKKRRSTPTVLDSAIRRVALATEEITYAMEDPSPEEMAKWSPRRRKVWRDSQETAKNSPVYLRLISQIGAQAVKAASERPPPRTVNVFFFPPELSREEWERRRDTLHGLDSRDRRIIETTAIDAVPTKPKPDDDW